MKDAIRRGIKTFLAGAAGVLMSATVIESLNSGSFRIGAQAAALGLIAALVAGVIAFAQAAAGSTANTVAGRAFRTFYQLLAAGLGTVGLVALTAEDALDFGQAVLRVVIVAAVSAVGTLALAQSETA